MIFIIISDNKYQILDITKFDIELSELKNKYMSSILEREKQILEYNKMIDEDIQLDITKISFNDLPQDISTNQLESIDFMINFD